LYRQLVIIASALDPASERIVTHARSFGLPLNVVFFQTFHENATQYLTRTWLVDPVEEASARKVRQPMKQQTPWKGRDRYVSFGEDGNRFWADALLTLNEMREVSARLVTSLEIDTGTSGA
jgi:hypothetical protein